VKTKNQNKIIISRKNYTCRGASINVVPENT